MLILLIAPSSCTRTGRTVSFSVQASDFFQMPSYLVTWPQFAMLLPPTLSMEHNPSISLKKRGRNLIVSGQYVPYDTYAAIKLDLRELGFREDDVREMKCYWSNPDGSLAELTKL